MNDHETAKFLKDKGWNYTTKIGVYNFYWHGDELLLIQKYNNRETKKEIIFKIS